MSEVGGMPISERLHAWLAVRGKFAPAPLILPGDPEATPDGEQVPGIGVGAGKGIVLDVYDPSADPDDDQSEDEQ